ncbi:MAG TPA: GNAT family N-acetyltransferase [Steroidobacteraceae bacterium]|jgi:putative acetyltransferase|nr:GNAT family N-acetyltransferase [Steroidobacteraceae bacterium]
MRIEPTDPESDSAQALIAMSDTYMTALYPAESNHLESAKALKAPNVLFLGCFLHDQLVGCGAVKILSDDGRYGELKRVFVLEGHRGKGYSKAIMEKLEGHLKNNGIALARLETGIRQPEALGLYKRLGYVERAPFGAYVEDPLSLFMEKRLDITS